MGLIHITHKNLASGVLLDEREFDATQHTLFADRKSERKPPPASTAKATGAAGASGGAATAGGEVGGTKEDAIAELLKGNAATVVELVAKAESLDWLAAVSDAESAREKRVTILKAIDARVDALGKQSGQGDQAQS